MSADQSESASTSENGQNHTPELASGPSGGGERPDEVNGQDTSTDVTGISSDAGIHSDTSSARLPVSDPLVPDNHLKATIKESSELSDSSPVPAISTSSPPQRLRKTGMVSDTGSPIVGRSADIHGGGSTKHIGTSKAPAYRNVSSGNISEDIEPVSTNTDEPFGSQKQEDEEPPSDAEGNPVDETGQGSDSGADDSVDIDDHDEEYENDDDDEEADSDDEELYLKFYSFTNLIPTVYDRRDSLHHLAAAGDLASPQMHGPRDLLSASLVAGDLFITGTHMGAIHVYTLPFFRRIFSTRCDQGPVTGLSVSPISTNINVDFIPDPVQVPTAAPETPKSRASKSPKRREGGGTPTKREGFLASCSQDGRVMIFPLSDFTKPIVRNFHRPLGTIALSPDYQNDQMYLTGGNSEKVILTVGGRRGVEGRVSLPDQDVDLDQDRAGTGWFHFLPKAIGKIGDTAHDRALTDGDGIVKLIRWSQSGKFVAIVTEESLTVMRTGTRIPDGVSPSTAWRKVLWCPKPATAESWVPRGEWVNPDWVQDDPSTSPTRSGPTSSREPAASGPKQDQPERFIMGWGRTIWIIEASGGVYIDPKTFEKQSGHSRMVEILVLGDYVISGLTFFTPTVLLLFTYSYDKEASSDTRLVGQNPAIRLIDTVEKEEIDFQSIEMSRYQSLRQSDYLLTSFFLPHPKTATVSSYGRLIPGIPGIPGMPGIPGISGIPGRGALGAISETLWDSGPAAVSLLNSGANMISQAGTIIGNTTGITTSAPIHTPTSPTSRVGISPKSPAAILDESTISLARALSRPGLKFFLCSPYEAVLAVKPDLVDKLEWFVQRHKYAEAWGLLDQHPDIVVPVNLGLSTHPSDSDLSINIHPQSESDGVGEGTGPPQSLSDFLDDDTSSVSTVTISGGQDDTTTPTAVAKSVLAYWWIGSYVTTGDWVLAGDVAHKALTRRSEWERWARLFAVADKYDAIADYLPCGSGDRATSGDKAKTKTKSRADGRSSVERLSLSAGVYTTFAVHYATASIMKFAELVEKWGGIDRLNVDPVIDALEKRITNGELTSPSREWKIALEALAPLYLARNLPTEALRCYLQLQNTDAAMQLVREERLLSAVVDDLRGFLLLRLPQARTEDATQEEVEEAASESMTLVVDESIQGTFPAIRVVKALGGTRYGPLPKNPVSGINPTLPTPSAQSDPESRSRLPIADRVVSPRVQSILLFMYMRGLWAGSLDRARAIQLGRSQSVDKGRLLVEDFADIAVSVFAEFDEAVLLEFFKLSSRFNINRACRVCEGQNRIRELVFLLTKTGQAKRALYLIIDRLEDISGAIEFVKENGDAELWDSLLEYSINRPEFIHRLLTDIGTSADPDAMAGPRAEPASRSLKLIRQIPDDLAIPGLRTGISDMMREYEIQRMMAEGAVNVLRAEVERALELWKGGGRNGVRFGVDTSKGKSSASSSRPGTSGSISKTKTGTSDGSHVSMDHHHLPLDEASNKIKYTPRPGHCVECDGLLSTSDPASFVGFRCGHVHHMTCLLDRLAGKLRKPGDRRTATGRADGSADITETTQRDEIPLAVLGNSHIYRTAAGLAVAISNSPAAGFSPNPSSPFPGFRSGPGTGLGLDEASLQSPIMAANSLTAVGLTNVTGDVNDKSTSPIQSPIIIPVQPIENPTDFAIGDARKVEDEIRGASRGIATAAAAVLAADRRRAYISHSRKVHNRRVGPGSVRVNPQQGGGIARPGRGGRAAPVNMSSPARPARVGRLNPGVPSAGRGHHPQSFGVDDVPLIPSSNADKIRWAKNLKRSVMSAGCAVCIQAAQD